MHALYGHLGYPGSLLLFLKAMHLCDVHDCLIKKGRGISPEVGSTKFQPVMFDMDLFGGKKVPRHIKRRTALDFVCFVLFGIR